MTATGESSSGTTSSLHPLVQEGQDAGSVTPSGHQAPDTNTASGMPAGRWGIMTGSVASGVVMDCSGTSGGSEQAPASPGAMISL